MDFKVLSRYYQLTKPGIIYGNLITGFAGYIVGAKLNFSIAYLLLTLFSISLVIASACVVNNIYDRKIDSHMSRTKKRSMVTQKISIKNAVIFAIILGISGLVILGLFINWITFTIGVIAFVDYVILYGLAKRRTSHSTLIGTLAGSASIVAGYTAATGKIDLTALLLFAVMTIWQMTHFYAIAIYRMKDYDAAKLPVLPVKRGLNRTKIEMLVYSILFLVIIIVFWYYSFKDYIFLFIMMALSVYWIYISIKGFTAKDTDKWARQMFFFSLIILLSLCLLIYKSLFISNLR